MKRVILLAPLLLAAQDAPGGIARATLNVQQGGTRYDDGVYRGGTFKLVERFDPPADHGPRDALIAFEGPGWESDKVAYRLYLDDRNVPDVFGKKLPAPVLDKIGMGKDDYHAPAAWGMDILQVNDTLGAGGIGVMRDGQVTQLGPSTISASIANLPGRAEVRVENRGFKGYNGPAHLSTRYAIAAGSRLTHVEARASGQVPQMVAGVILHPGTQVLEGGKAKWRYLASWGKQSLARDGLGLALFYSTDYVDSAGTLDGNLALTFCDPGRIRYAFAAAWVQEPGAPKTAAQFRKWLDDTVAELGRTQRSEAACRPR